MATSEPKAAPLRVISLESRRGAETARMLERHGAEVIAAPSMKEVPLSDQLEALAFGESLLARECDVLVLLTGVGLRALLDVLATRWSREAVIEALRTTQLACRGPKPVAVLKELGIKPTLVAPEPNTTRELIDALASVPLEGKRIFVQEYGKPNEELESWLRDRGARVQTVPVYAWQLPDDLAPLEHAVDALVTGGADAVLFMSAQQLAHLLEIAERKGQAEAALAALQSDVVVASIGPVTTSALLERGIRADVEPEHPKMGHLVKALIERAPDVLATKRTRLA